MCVGVGEVVGERDGVIARVEDKLSMAMRISLLVARWFPCGRSGEVPVGGHGDSPGTAGCFPGLFGQGLHPLSVECVFESDRFALGDDDVGVVEEPVNEGAGEGFVHELVEA